MITAKRDLTVYAKARPKRIAFLALPHPHLEKIIDGYVMFASNTWGGRFSPIIPVYNNEISEDYFNLLDNFDPDAIYANGDVDEQLKRKIIERIGPLEFIETVYPQEDDKVFPVPERSLTAVGIQSVPKNFHMGHPPFNTRKFIFLRREDQQNLDDKGKFITRNFGAYSAVDSLSRAFSGLPTDFHDIESITVEDVIQFAQNRRGHLLPFDVNRAHMKRVVQYEFDSFLKGTHFVVGDTLDDFYYFWNRQLVAGTDMISPQVWVPRSILNDHNLLGPVLRFVLHMSWMGDRNTPHIVSCSMSQIELNELIAKAQSLANLQLESRILRPGEFPVRKYHNSFAPFIPSWGTYEMFGERQPARFQYPYGAKQVLISLPQPAIQPTDLERGDWMVDLGIEMPGDPQIYNSAESFWKLPRRQKLSVPFLNMSMGRITKQGIPSVQCTNDSVQIKIINPPAEHIFYSLLDVRPPTYKVKNAKAWTPGRFQDLKISDKGSYLKGILQLFNGLGTAGRFFRDPFWRALFFKLAGQPLEDVTDISEKINRIFIPNSPPAEGDFIFTAAELKKNLEETTNIIFSRRKDSSPTQVPLKDMKALFSSIREQFKREGMVSQHYHEDESFEELKRRELNDLLKNRVLFQGVSQACPNCGSRNWFQVELLSSRLDCPSCFTQFALLADPTWSFKLNGLVVNGITKHGLVAVIQALYSLQSGSSGGFAYEVSHDVLEGTNLDNLSVFTDIDLFALKEGRIIFAEVKSSLKMFKLSDCNKMFEVAKELRPDDLMFLGYKNSPTDELSGDVKNRLREMREELKPFDVTVTFKEVHW